MAWLLRVSGVVIALLASRIWLVVRDDATGKGGTPVIDLKGNWVVTTVERAGTQFSVPASVGASFEFADDGKSFDASGGAAGYSCTYSRSGNTLVVSECTATLAVPVDLSDIEKRTAAAFEAALNGSTLTVTATSDEERQVHAGGVVLTLVRAK